MHRFGYSLLVLAACGSTPTTIELNVKYHDEWSLTELRLAADDRVSNFDARHAIEVLVPDEWAGTEHTISLIGMRDVDAWAQGTVRVIPERGETVSAPISLALLTCATTCEQSGTTCVAGGTATCELQADGCLGYSVAVACGTGKRCSQGACIDGDPLVLPSNSPSIGELEETGLVLDVEDGFIFDTTSNCYMGSPLGDCTPVTPNGSPEICVCRSDALTIHNLEVRGSRALALLAFDKVTVKGDVVITPGVGEGATYTDDTGTAGGSFGTIGGNSAMPVFGTPDLVPLVGGMRGQGMKGGRGGGALQITANMSVRVEGTINNGGAGGTGPEDTVGTCNLSVPEAHGGGSGGALLLEARHVDVVGSLGANGGGGTGGGVKFPSPTQGYCASSGADGGIGMVAAGGPTVVIDCGNVAVAIGAEGGSGSIGDGNGSDSGAHRSGIAECYSNDPFVTGRAGGGGGGAGRIRINTENDPCGCSGSQSPTPSFGAVVVN